MSGSEDSQDKSKGKDDGRGCLLSKWQPEPKGKRTEQSTATMNGSNGKGGKTPNAKTQANGTKDPTKSLKSDTESKDPEQKSSETPTGRKTSKNSKREKSAPKGSPKLAENHGSSSNESSTSGESIAQVFKDSISNLAASMNKGFLNLGKLLKDKNEYRGGRHEVLSSSDSESEEESASDTAEPPAPKRQKSDGDGASLSEESNAILSQLEKQYNVTDQDGPDLNASLAKIVKNLLGEKTDEEKLNEIKKRYPKPKNCEILTETKVNSAIWNNISDKARTGDIKLQKAQKALVKGITAVVQVINEVLNESEMPPKEKIVDTLMDGVQLLANANIEVNIRRREALKPELHTSYRYLCAPSNPITTELFGDDLPKAVKDITDTNRITSKISRERKDGYKRSRDTSASDKYGKRYPYKYSGSKNYNRPFSNKREGGKKSGPKNQH